MVDIGANQYEWDDWFEASGDVLTHIPLLPVHGNHESLAQNYFAHFSLPNNEEWYSARIGDLQVVSLNDTVRDFDHISVDQVDYLREVSANQMLAGRSCFIINLLMQRAQHTVQTLPFDILDAFV